MTSQSEEESWRVSFSPPRCPELWSSEEITCITSRNITDSRRDITTYQLIWLQLSEEPELVILLPLASADQSQKPSDSTSLELRKRELRVMLERPLLCSEWLVLIVIAIKHGSWKTKSNQLQHFEWSHSLVISMIISKRRKICTLYQTMASFLSNYKYQA